MRILILSLFLFSNAWANYSPKHRPLDVLHYDLEFTVDPEKALSVGFTGRATLKIKMTATLNEIQLDAEQMKFNGAEWDGKVVPLSVDGKQITVALPEPAAKGSTHTLTLGYVGKIQKEQLGLFLVKDPDAPKRAPLLFTQLEAEGARRFFPCNDEPMDKATMALTAKVPAKYTVLSFGNLTQDTAFKKASEKWHTVSWSLDKPHSTYLASLAIGEFGNKKIFHGQIPIEAYVDKKALAKADFVLDVNKKALVFLEQYLHTPYPWAKYTSVGLPTFVWGGMENTSTTFLNQDRMLLWDPKSETEKHIIAGLSSHELAHQWFGDLVTMQWWNDLWLNEAFATFGAFKSMEAVFSKEESATTMLLHLWDDYFRQEDGPRSHAIVTNKLLSPQDAFDSISYTKGAQVLRMLEYYMGEGAFRQGMKHYLNQFAFSNATYLDFFSTLEKNSGQNLKNFQNTWLLQRGYPVLSYKTEWDSEDKEFTFQLKQRPNHPEDKSLFAFKVPVVLHRKTEPAYEKSLLIDFDGKKAEVEMESILPAPPEWVTVNPQGVALVKVESPDNHLQLQAQFDSDPISRMTALYTLAQPLGDSKSLSADVEKILANAITNDPSPFVRYGLMDAFIKVPARGLPTSISLAMLAACNQDASATQAPDKGSYDTHALTMWKTRLLKTLAKANVAQAKNHIIEALLSPKSSSDDVAAASQAVAQLGDKDALDLLRRALTKQGARGYRFKFGIYLAQAAVPSGSATREISKLTQFATADLLGRLGWVVQDNTVLKSSEEWSKFLKHFILSDQNHGEVIQTRLLNTIEEVKNAHVKALLNELAEKSPSEEVKESARRILEKNFAKQDQT